jgi:CPA2 family monovalent cation:H+ antiporter-2
MTVPFAVSLPMLNEVVALFVASVGMAYACYRLKLAPVTGFLIAGVIIGPNALGFVQEQDLVDMLAEIGVILLLFTIGIEFSLEKVGRIRQAIVVGGGTQVLLTVALVAFGLNLIGVDWNAAIYTGCLVALSSTAIVLGLLSERSETDTPHGQLSLAILIFQDLAIVLMVLLIPLLSGEATTPAAIGAVLLKAVVLIAAVLLLARKGVPWVLEAIARTGRQELFLLTVVAICFGTAAISSIMGVSLALGAFLAGLIVSESRFSDQALSEILPLKTVFNAVFFVSVGMLLDLSFLLSQPLLVFGTAVAVILIKLATSWAGVAVLRYPTRVAIATSIGLAQIGEFSFVLERAGRAVGLSPAGMGDAGSQTFIAAAVFLMLITPFQVANAPRLAARFTGKREEDAPSRASKMEDHVVVIGFGEAGRRLAHVLSERGIPFTVIELSPSHLNDMKAMGIPHVVGDALRPHILEAAGIRTAKMVVLVMNDPEVAPGIISQARFINPTVQIVVRTRYMRSMERLQQRGADIVVPEELETTVRIFSHVLGAYMIPRDEIDRQVKLLRDHDYGVMRGSIQEAHLMVLQGLDEDGLHTRAVAVRPGAPAAGKTLQELALRRSHELTVIAVRRGMRTIASPAGDFLVEPNDRLVMIGNADRFAQCADLFRVSPEPT